MISYFTGEIKMARTLRWFPKMVLAQCCPCLHSCLHADSQRGLRLFLKNTTNWGCGRYPESPWLACRLLSSENSPILPTQLPCWRLPTQLHTGATTPAELTVKIPKALWLQLTTIVLLGYCNPANTQVQTCTSHSTWRTVRSSSAALSWGSAV